MSSIELDSIIIETHFNTILREFLFLRGSLLSRRGSSKDDTTNFLTKITGEMIGEYQAY